MNEDREGFVGKCFLYANVTYFECRFTWKHGLRWQAPLLAQLIQFIICSHFAFISFVSSQIYIKMAFIIFKWTYLTLVFFILLYLKGSKQVTFHGLKIIVVYFIMLEKYGTFNIIFKKFLRLLWPFVKIIHWKK